MSIGDWLYYKRKFKLFILPRIFSGAKQKRILALTYERNWQLPFNYQASYFSVNAGLSFAPAPDLIIEREFNDGKALYDALYKGCLEKYGLKVFWFIDAHVADDNRIHYCDHFDFVFVAQSPYIEKIKKITTCKNIFWLPLCYPGQDDEIIENRQSAKYPVSFVGTLGDGYEKRNEMIDFLKEEYNESFIATTDYHNRKTLVQESKITTNYSLKDDLNFRIFETLGQGTELVTNYVPDIDCIEGLKERLNCFHDLEGLKKSIDKLLLNDPYYKHDMVEVQSWIKEHHTMKQRMAEMLAMIDTGKQVEYK